MRIEPTTSRFTGILFTSAPRLASLLCSYLIHTIREKEYLLIQLPGSTLCSLLSSEFPLLLSVLIFYLHFQLFVRLRIFFIEKFSSVKSYLSCNWNHYSSIRETEMLDLIYSIRINTKKNEITVRKSKPSITYNFNFINVSIQ